MNGALEVPDAYMVTHDFNNGDELRFEDSYMLRLVARCSRVSSRRFNVVVMCLVKKCFGRLFMLE